MHEPERFRSAEYLAVLDRTGTSGHCTFVQAAIDAMQTAAESGYPLEVCGLLIGSFDSGNWQVDEVRQIENLNRDRASDRFQLDPDGYQRVDRELRGSGREIIGVFHSHPDCPAKPSPTDLENAWEDFLYPIVSVYKGKAADQMIWTLNENGSKFRPVPFSSDES